MAYRIVFVRFATSKRKEFSGGKFALITSVGYPKIGNILKLFYSNF